jgi:hypothetical protein
LGFGFNEKGLFLRLCVWFIFGFAHFFGVFGKAVVDPWRIWALNGSF